MRRAGKVAAVLISMFLFVGLFILPAAAHHKDGHEQGPPETAGENGGGGGADGGQENGSGGDTQGNSGSNPDGGGVDKPYDAAGQPARSQGASYYDGNNGCGQDKKSGEPREGWFGQSHNGWDDNNGWCGKPVTREEDGTGTPSGTPTEFTEITESAPVSLVVASGSAATFEPSVETVASSGRPTTVLGARLSRAAALTSTGPAETQVLGIKLVRGQPLAMTGLSMTSYLLIAAVLGLIGAFAMFVGRKSEVRI